jgi:hypothetical protein
VWLTVVLQALFACLGNLPILVMLQGKVNLPMGLPYSFPSSSAIITSST